eukprot:12020443-Karenia_brevis.AAC.1
MTFDLSPDHEHVDGPFVSNKFLDMSIKVSFDSCVIKEFHGNINFALHSCDFDPQKNKFPPCLGVKSEVID